MIYSLNGTLKMCLDYGVVLDVNGVGYQVYCTQQMIQKYKADQPQQFMIYHHIREDAQLLFGFETLKERQLFETLISVSGIGPKVALGMLSNMSMADIVSAIQTGNVMVITKIPGIGQKTAQRLIIELKDKVQGMVGVNPVNNTVETPTNQQHDSDDIVQALRQLGYQKDEIKRTFMKQATQLAAVDTIEDQIKILLKYL